MIGHSIIRKNMVFGIMILMLVPSVSSFSTLLTEQKNPVIVIENRDRNNILYGGGDGPAQNWTEIQKLLASDGTENDVFGWSVSLDGDTALIGAPGDDASKGSAYVFIRTGSTWTQQQKLLASDGSPSDYFGWEVSLDGDTALIGAYGDDSVRGSAYVFTRTGTTWTQQAKLLASDGAAGDEFGFDVALSGDTALIGSVCDDSQKGSAYVFIRTGTTWTQQQKLIAVNGANWDDFGFCVCVEGDTALIGAIYGDGIVVNSGTAYVFIRTGTTWTQQQKLFASDGASNDIFGHSVSLSGDTALIGARFDVAYAGSAYVFIRTGTTWTQQQKLTASDPGVDDSFGISVSLSGDTALIGAMDEIHQDDSGAAYVFTRTGTIWTQQAKLLPSDGQPGDWFGGRVSLDGDTALIGAAWDDDNGFDTGSAYIFTKESENQPPVANFTYSPKNPTNTDIIQFTDTSTDPDGTIVSWLWDFGDGITATNQNPTHRYIHGGTYMVTLTVTDNRSAQDTIQSPVEVLTVNYPPNTPNIPVGPIKGIAGIDYIYKTQTTDPNGNYIKYGWDWDGDLIVDTWTTFMQSGIEISTHHTWSEPCTYTIRVKAKDTYGLESNWSEPLTVRMYLLGDVNGDDRMNFGDINPFVLALTDGEAGYYNAYPNGYYYTADCNLDNQVNFGDINPFVALLTRSK